MALTYPDFPNDVIKRKYYDFFSNLPLFIPDEKMGKEFSNMLDKYPVTPYLSSKDSLVRWVVFIHNKYNEMTGKDEISIDEAMNRYYELYMPKPVYLHQVKALRKDGTYQEFKDLDEAFEAYKPETYDEWRVHFHVPLFLETYGLLESTQQEIRETMEIQKESPFTRHLEIETYTWGVLPAAYQLPMADSISREIKTITDLLGLWKRPL